MWTPNRVIGVCAAIVAIALLVVGIAAGQIVRHVLQAALLCPAAVLGLYGNRWAKWAALPLLFFWLAATIMIWNFVLGNLSLASGDFTPVEIAMIAMIDIAALAGLFACHLNKDPGGVVAVLVSLVLFVCQAGLTYLAILGPLQTDRMFVDWITG